MLVQELIEFAQKTYPNSLYLSKKYESFTYNLSVYLMNKKNLENALWLIELSLNLSELLQRTKDQLIPRKILHLQCLSALGRHSECAEIARENICSDSTIDVKHLETLVMLFSMASFKRNPQNHEFLIQSSEISEEKLLKLVNLEYKSIFLYCRDNLMDDIQQKFLDSVSTIRRRLPLQTALNYSVKNLQLSRKLGKRDTQDKCNALIDYINSLDMQDSAISNYLAISTCELFLWKAEQKEIDLKLLQNAFKVWNDIFVELPVIKACTPFLI
ncbi:hypothetical protein HK103_004906 [Boothiomyces macroporosus]|uniref:Uncharacterized protein n=1 Tax=Boothiomyces macroporosus TaxID=261099 RepID=A0AAD5Y812_9FUNG|nr:hypothetical protein HK103_004906 [Boothiomyces macroporosus]